MSNKRSKASNILLGLAGLTTAAFTTYKIYKNSEEKKIFFFKIH